MDPTTSRPQRPEPGLDPHVLPTLLGSGADLDALEHQLLVLAAHPATGGADRAWLVRFDAPRGLLEGWDLLDRVEDTELTAILTRTRRSHPETHPEREALRAWALMPESFEGACDRAWRTGEPASGPGGDTPGAPWDTMAWVRVVPLDHEGGRHGLLVSGWLVRPATEPAADALHLVARAALAAQRTAHDAASGHARGHALAEFARITVTASNVAETAHALVRLTAQALGVRWAALWRMREDGTPRLEVTHGPAPGRDAWPRLLQANAAAAAVAPRVTHGLGVTHLPVALTDAGELGAWAFQPLVTHGRVLGVLAAWQGAEPGSETREWASGDLEALATLADQAALLFEHAQGIDERATLERKREDLASRLREQDRLAMLGEMSARVAEEARQPLAGIAAIAARVLQDLPAEDPSREAFLAMEREIARVDRMLGEQLEYARLEPPRLRVEAFNTVVQEALRGSAEALARHRARVVKHYEPDLPQLLLDGARIRRVVGNIVAAALEQMPVGGRMRIETRRNGTWIVFEVLHDRAREQGDALEQLFVPFAASLGPAGPTPPVPPSGAALGLGVAHQIVREHGGELRVRIEDEWSSAFVMTLPVLENQDRRKGPDRRGARRDRRRREEGEG